MPDDENPPRETEPKRPLRDAAGRLLPGAVLNPGGRAQTYKSAIRRLTGAQGERIWEVLSEIMEGKPWVPLLADGRQGPPQIPTTADRLKAALELRDSLIGKPVSVTDAVKAEREAGEAADLAALTDAELERQARAWLSRVTPEDAELVLSPQVRALPSTISAGQVSILDSILAKPAK